MNKTIEMNSEQVTSPQGKFFKRKGQNRKRIQRDEASLSHTYSAAADLGVKTGGPLNGHRLEEKRNLTLQNMKGYISPNLLRKFFPDLES